MALINPSTLYSGGQATFNDTPAMNYYLKQQAKEKATADALEKYYLNLDKGVTSAGMREQELPAFEAARNNMAEYWVNNKEKLLKGDALAQAEYNKLINQAKQIAQTSKNAYAIDKSVNSARLTNPNAMNWSEDTLGIKDDGTGKMIPTGGGLAAHHEPAYIVQDGKPILNPAFKAFDVSTVTYNPKPYTSKDWTSLYESNYKGKPVSYEKVVEDVDPYTSMVSFKGIYGKDQQREMGDNMRLTYQQSPDVKYNTDKSYKSTWAKNNPDLFDRFNQVHQQIYGRPIENNEDLVASMAIDHKNNEVVTQPKLMPKFGAREELKDIKIRGRIAARGAANVPTQLPDVYGMVSNEPGETNPFIQGFFQVKIPKNLTEEQINDITGKPDKFAMREHPYATDKDGNRYFLKDDKGNLYDANKKPIDKDQVIARTNARIGVSQKAIQQGKIVPKASGQNAQAPNKKTAIKTVKIKGADGKIRNVPEDIKDDVLKNNKGSVLVN